MAIGDSKFVYNFEVITNGKVVGTIAARGKEISVVIFEGGRSSYSLDQIDSIELIHAEGASLPQGGRGMVLGALVAGPLGAIAGAGMGRLLRECHFVLTLKNGRALLCKGLHKVYADFEAHRKILAFEERGTKAIDTLLSKTTPALPEAGASTEDAPPPTVITVPMPVRRAHDVFFIPKKTSG
ncbi:hypothetical protein [Massilia brevitalea]|uniref:hypothetical protein n=1 Tax=Massilia brevitalea TaxID=442526 RepID=UPI002738CADB|nr:hypothetical protein [Massilia brevitalea]